MNYPCPECGIPLLIIPSNRPGWLQAYCGYGRCRSIEANDGGEGKTPEDAVARLHRAYEKAEEKRRMP